MNTRNTLFMAALAASVTIAISAVALHSTSASVNTRETVSLTDAQNDGGVSSLEPSTTRKSLHRTGLPRPLL
jgi:hypothetical protein